ncbi:tRNA adenosine deaminase-associated protein [Propionibacteriaceae bacterium Y2011]
MNGRQGTGSDFDDDEYESFALTDDDSDADLDGDDEDDDDLDDDDLDDDDLDDEDDDDDDLEDADEDDIDFVMAAYTEEGQRSATALTKDLANDLEELIHQLRRLPGDAGAVGFVSLVEDFFVIVRVRGRNVQVLLSDGSMAGDWPIARDVADFLGLREIPDEDDGDPIGDLNILGDSGVGEMDMARYCEDIDSGSVQVLFQIADKIAVGPVFRQAAEAELDG